MLSKIGRMYKRLVEHAVNIFKSILKLLVFLYWFRSYLYKAKLQ